MIRSQRRLIQCIILSGLFLGLFQLNLTQLSCITDRTGWVSDPGNDVKETLKILSV